MDQITQDNNFNLTIPPVPRGGLLEYLYSDALEPDLSFDGASVQLQRLPDAVNGNGGHGAWELFEQYSVDTRLTSNATHLGHEARWQPQAEPLNDTAVDARLMLGAVAAGAAEPLRAVENGLAQTELLLRTEEEISLPREASPTPPPSRAVTPRPPERPPKRTTKARNEQNIAPPSTPTRRGSRKKRAASVEVVSPKPTKSHKRRKASAASSATPAQVKEEEKKPIVHWTESEIDKLVHHVLDNDGVLLGRVGGTKKLSLHDAKKLSREVFAGVRSAESIRTKFGDLRRTFDWIQELESFTGGGGDPDETQGEDDVLSVRISNARRAGKEVGLLTAEKFETFKHRGWYKSFANVMRDHVGMVRPQVFNSESLSDEDQAVIELQSDESEGEQEVADRNAALTPSTPKPSHPTPSASRTPLSPTPDHVVSKPGSSVPAAPTPSSSASAVLPSRGRSQTPAAPVPPHKPKAPKLKGSFEQLLQANADRFSTVCDKLVAHLDGLKSAREKQEQALERTLTLKAAQKAVSDPNSSAEFRAAAEKVLMGQFAKMQ